MNPDEDIEFDERVLASLRGELSSVEQESFVQSVKDDPAKKERSEQLALTYELLSLCAAAESPPTKVPPATLDRLRETVTRLIKPPPVPWYKKPLVLAVAALIVFGLAALYITLLPPSLPTGTPVIEFAMLRKFSPSDDALKAALVGERIVYLEDATSLEDWEKTWPPSDKRPAFKVLFLVHNDWTTKILAQVPQTLLSTFKMSQTEIGRVVVTQHNFHKTFRIPQEAATWKEAIQKARLSIEERTLKAPGG